MKFWAHLRRKAPQTGLSATMITAALRTAAHGKHGFAAVIIPLLSLARPLPPLLVTSLAAGIPAFGLGEDVLKFGGEAGWKQFGLRDGLAELENVRPGKVLALSSVDKTRDASLDMSLSFDEGDAEMFIDNTGNYTLSVSEAVHAAGTAWARLGAGAAVFSKMLSATTPGAAAEAPLVITARRGGALFSAGRSIGDFSIEFWLYPGGMENGEEVLGWTAAVKNGAGVYKNQSLICTVSKNRIEWSIKNFFFAPKTERSISAESMDLSLASSAPIVPKLWSHHLLRFDGETGLLEYLVNGVLEDIAYTTSSGVEGGDIFMPVAGERGGFTLGKRFNGMIDNFRIHKRFVEQAALRRYSQSGRAQSVPIDLGAQNSAVLRVDAKGGAYGENRRNKSGDTGSFDFPGGAQIQFFIRGSDSLYSWDNAAWRTFTPGKPLNTVLGRYIELAAQFYPDGDFETTPYLEELNVVFARKSAPEPPPYLRAAVKDGCVELSWRPSKDDSVAGYIVYYGTASGDYFGEGSSSGPSPVDVGKRLSVSLDNLVNGVLYYFSVSSYDDLGQPGDYSREISARPLRISE